MTRTRSLRAMLFVGVVAATSATAGQMHLDFYGLEEVRGGTDYLHAGTVASTDARAGTIVIELTRTWKAPERSSEPPGPPATVKVYGGVEWTDPNESPIDRRLHGFVPLDSVTVGEEVILVPLGPVDGPYELLRTDASTTRKLDIFYGAGGVSAWEKEAPVAELVDALADYDLGPIAYRRLEATGLLDAKALVETLEAGDPGRLVWKFFDEADGAARARVLADAESLVREHPRALLPLVRAAAPKFDTTDAGALAAIAALLDPREREHMNAIYEVRYRLLDHAEAKRTRATDPFVGFMVRFEKYRPDHMSSDDELESFVKGLSARSRSRFLPAMASNVYTSTHARDGLDSFLFHTVINAMTQDPQREYLSALREIDPAGERILSTRRGIMDALLGVAVAAVKKDRRWARDAFELIEPWLSHGVEATPELRAAYESATRSQRRQSRSVGTELVELLPGQSYVFPSGYRVFVEGRGEPASLGIYAKRDSGRRLKLGETWGGYSEGAESGRVFTVLRQADGKLKIALLAPSKEEIRPKSESTLAELAERAARSKGCTKGAGALSRTHWIYRWEGTGSRYRCVAVVGAMTGWLGRVDREGR